jgi:hypothetical protein
MTQHDVSDPDSLINLAHFLKIWSCHQLGWKHFVEGALKRIREWLGWTKRGEDAATETTANEDGSSPCRQGENNVEELSAGAAGCPKGQDTALVSRVDLPIKFVKVTQPLHCQAVLVSFSLVVHLHQMPGKPFTGTLGLGTVG